MQFLYNIKQGFQNLIYWLPVIWKDRNWDYSHFLEILKHKIDAIRLDVPNWTGRNNEKIAEDIEHAVALIDALVNEEYQQQAFDEHAFIWGRAKMVFKPISDKFSSAEFVYPSVSDKATQKKAEEELSKLLFDARAKRREAIDTLFRIIKDNFETWWD